MEGGGELSLVDHGGIISRWDEEKKLVAVKEA